MGKDSMGPGDQRRTPQNASPRMGDTHAQPKLAADAALSAIGYEAADPSLLPAEWAEVLQLDVPARHLR